MTHRLGLLVLTAFLVGITSGCSTPPTELPGAYFKIPVYQPSTLEDSMGGHYSDSIGGAPTSESLSWFLKTSDAPAKVVRFYASKLPYEARADDEALENEPDDSEHGKVVAKFTYKPTGAEEDEDVTITVRERQLQITEVLKPGKRKG